MLKEIFKNKYAIIKLMKCDLQPHNVLIDIFRPYLLPSLIKPLDFTSFESKQQYLLNNPISVMTKGWSKTGLKNNPIYFIDQPDCIAVIRTLLPKEVRQVFIHLIPANNDLIKTDNDIRLRALYHLKSASTVGAPPARWSGSPISVKAFNMMLKGQMPNDNNLSKKDELAFIKSGLLTFLERPPAQTNNDTPQSILEMIVANAS